MCIRDRRYPPSTALSWDRVGLATGDPSQPVAHVHFAVDATLEVIEEAIALGADLLVTHHPLLLRGVHSVATTSAKGRSVTRAIVADLAIYCAHTNADVADPGAVSYTHLDVYKRQRLGRPATSVGIERPWPHCAETRGRTPRDARRAGPVRRGRGATGGRAALSLSLIHI